jgi:glycerol-3-phosphate dehydrogenase
VGWGEWLQRAKEEGVKAGLDEEAAGQVARRYGVRSSDVYETAKQSDLADRIVPGLPFVKAEVVYAAANEAAVSLEDILRRRVPLLVLERCNQTVLVDAARWAGQVLGWSGERCDWEVSAVLEGQRGA